MIFFADLTNTIFHMLLLQAKDDDHIPDGNLFKSLHKSSSGTKVPNYYSTIIYVQQFINHKNNSCMHGWLKMRA